MSHICFFSLLLQSFDIDGSKYEANVNTAFYTNPAIPVRTNVCYPTDANAVDFRSDGSGTPLSLTGNGGCRSFGAQQDFVCGPDDNTCLSYAQNNCRCDYDGTIGTGVSGLQAGQQIVDYNNGVCGAGNLQPSDYVDAAACWYDTSVPIAMSKYTDLYDMLYT